MPITTNWINKQINQHRIEDNEKKSKEHKSNSMAKGRKGISAGMLFQPVRFQVLKTIGLQRKPFDAYTLGVFEIGNDVEAKFVASLERAGVLLKGKDVEAHGLKWDESKDEAYGEYRGVNGYVDAVVNTAKMEKDWGVMPWECKSVTSYKLKHVKRTGVDWQHKLQACLYALVMGKEKFAVTIISKEHPDPMVHIFEVSEMKQEIDQIISDYAIAMENFKKDRTLPPLNAGRVAWAVNPKYAMYDEFYMTAPDSEVIKKLEELELI